jgi:hypothetical protein
MLDLNGAIDTFRKTNPYTVGIKRDSQTRKLIYYVTRVDPVPLEVAAIAGDVVHNLRTALDHVHQHLFMIGTGTSVPSKDVAFYIDGHPNPNHYKTSAPAKLRGLRKDAIDALDRIEPHKGGKGHYLWILNELNNIDKHRALVIVASAYRSVSIWPIAQRLMSNIPGGITITDEIAKVMHDASFIRPADNLCPLKAGDELFIDAADAEPNQKIKFRFDVAIYEPQVIESKPIVETLHQLVQFVGDTVMALKPLLK